MKMRVMIPAAVALGLVGFAYPRPVLAAHAGAPYTNVDHSNDAGNNTGDSQVDSLNAQQLSQAETPPPAPPVMMVQPQPPTVVVVPH